MQYNIKDKRIIVCIAHICILLFRKRIFKKRILIIHSFKVFGKKNIQNIFEFGYFGKRILNTILFANTYMPNIYLFIYLFSNIKFT